jgi:Flp pilus assembly protein TadG
MKRRIKRQEGQALVEFAIVIPVLLLIVLGIMQFGILFNNYITLTDAVRTGARQAAVSRTDPDPEQKTKDRVKQAAGHINDASLEITVTPYDPVKGTNTWAAGGDVTVKATYPFSLNMLGWVVMSGRLTSQTTERVE